MKTGQRYVYCSIIKEDGQALIEQYIVEKENKSGWRRKRGKDTKKKLVKREDINFIQDGKDIKYVYSLNKNDAINSLIRLSKKVNIPLSIVVGEMPKETRNNLINPRYESFEIMRTEEWII